MAVLKEWPYVAMINQRFSRTYATCIEFRELIAWDVDCCPDCLAVAQDQMDSRNPHPYLRYRRIHVHPPLPEGVNKWIADGCDHAMNFEAIVCCRHFHAISSLSREQWTQIAKRCGATPFFADFGTGVLHDQNGNRRSSSSGSTDSPIRSNRRLVGVPRVEKDAFPTTKCEFHGVRHPMYGKCPACFPGATNA